MKTNIVLCFSFFILFGLIQRTLAGNNFITYLCKRKSYANSIYTLRFHLQVLLKFSTRESKMITVEKIWLTADAVWIRTSDGREACECFADYPRLKYATPQQRANYHADAFGINWPDIDEDLSFEGFFKSKNQSELYRVFLAHPELNASAVARRMGISQSLFAQYISGTKRPSEKRLAEIYATLRAIGEELLAIPVSVAG